MRPEKLLLVALIGLIIMYAVLRSEAHENDQIKLSLKNRAGNAISSLTDGDVVKLNVVLTNAASQTTEVTFELAPGNKPIGKCTVPNGAKACESEGIQALGWFWSEGGKSLATRTIRAVSALTKEPVTNDVRVAPRPVVMVHGFLSAAILAGELPQRPRPVAMFLGIAVIRAAAR